MPGGSYNLLCKDFFSQCSFMSAILSVFTSLFESEATAHYGVEIVYFKRFPNLIRQLPNAYARDSSVLNTYVHFEYVHFDFVRKLLH